MISLHINTINFELQNTPDDLFHVFCEVMKRGSDSKDSDDTKDDTCCVSVSKNTTMVKWKRRQNANQTASVEKKRRKKFKQGRKKKSTQQESKQKKNVSKRNEKETATEQIHKILLKISSRRGKKGTEARAALNMLSGVVWKRIVHFIKR